MYIIIDDRESVTSSYATSFDREGIAFLGFWPDVFQDWLCTADAGDLAAVDAFLLGDQACCGQCVFVTHLDDLIDDLSVQDTGHESRANAF